MANINLDQVEKLIVSLYRRYYEANNIDRKVVGTFIDSALRDCGLVITNNFELEKLKLCRDTMPIKPKFKPDDIIRAKDDGEELKIYAVEYHYYICSGGVTVEFKDQDEFELVEQKPVEWSEEDETTKNNISHIIRQYDKISKRENKPCYYVGDCLLWMQNIKDRVQPQPKQKWSEEDEKNLQWLDTICERIYHRSDPQVAPNAALKLREWLKSLRPQKQWKPTEEQIAILRDVASGTKDPVAYGATMGVIIQGLEQLKAL